MHASAMNYETQNVAVRNAKGSKSTELPQHEHLAGAKGTVRANVVQALPPDLLHRHAYEVVPLIGESREFIQSITIF